MSIDDFIEAARDHGKYTEEGDSCSANEAYDRIIVERSKLRKLPDQGRSTLIELLYHANASVRMWAAFYLLPTDEELAAKALAMLSKKSGLIPFSAKMTLEEWEAGRLKID